MAESLEKSSSVYYVRQKGEGTHAHNCNLPIHYTKDSKRMGISLLRFSTVDIKPL